jgi:hypothetical protein
MSRRAPKQAVGAIVNVHSWLVAIVIVLTGIADAVRAQDALVLDTYTCGDFLADLGDRGNSARLRRSLIMISWAAGYAAARHNEVTGSPARFSLDNRLRQDNRRMLAKRDPVR